MTAHNLKVDTTDRELIIKRTFNAPRELVWKAWTDPAQVVKWWGPKGFTNTLLELDVRPGGVWQHIMHGPDGTDYPNRVVFLEVVKPERLVWSHGDDTGGHPCQFHVTVTFDALGKDKTEVTMRKLFETSEQRDEMAKLGVIEGAKETFGRLEALLRT